MTLPSAIRDLLMLAPSLRRDPVASVLEARSEPARSTRLSRANTLRVSSSTSFWWIFIVKIECDRDDRAFILVSPCVRMLLPCSISSSTFSSCSTTTSCSPLT